MGWWRRFRHTLRPRRIHDDIADELSHHLEMRQREGLSPRAARERFGSPERVREATREMDILTWLETALQDLRHTARMMRRNPGFTAVIVLSLAIGIGANAAVFSLVNAVLLKTLPVPNPGQIFFMSETDGINHASVFSYPVYRQMASAATGTAMLGAATSITVLPLAQKSGVSPQVATELISGEYFAALGLAPWRGRWIDAGDNRALGGSPVAVLSYGFWMRQFGGDANVIGRPLTLRGLNLTVVGIAPPEFTGLDPSQAVDVWVPLTMQPALHAGGNRWSYSAKDDEPWPPQERMSWLQVFARLRDPGSANRLASAMTAPLEASFRRIGNDGLPYRVVLSPGGRGGDRLRRSYGAPLKLLMVMVALMLLIAVANVATLLLARMVRRRREIAIRLAVGISRTRLARQLLTEGLLLTATAGIAAVVVAIWTGKLLVRLAAGHGSLPFAPDLDWRVWTLLASLALAAGLVLGLLPAWQANRADPAAALKQEGLHAGGAARVPLGRLLVAAQVALSVLLVSSAALFGRSLAAMFDINLGFDRAHVLTVELAMPDGGLPPAELAELDRRLLARVNALPGVRAAALDQSGLDDWTSDTSGISLAGRVDPPGGLQSNETTVSRDYFDAVGMSLVRGRGFAASDGSGTPSVVVVNQAFARRFYPGLDPVGHTFGYDAHSTNKFRIVGIVADARVDDPHTPAAPLFYRLLEQSDNPALKLEVRAAGDPLALARPVRAALGAMNMPLRVRSASSVGHRLDEMLLGDRLVAQLSAGFGLLALALACLGLYGVMAYAVAARGGEFGVRIALGASRSHVVGLVLREAGLMLAVGLAAGLPLTLATGRWIQPLLPGASATDPATLATAVAVMVALPFLVALHPAWRAAHADPARMLRAE